MRTEFCPFGWDTIPFLCTLGGRDADSWSIPSWLQDDFINKEHYSTGARGLRSVQEFVLKFLNYLLKRYVQFYKGVSGLLIVISEDENTGVTDHLESKMAISAGSGEHSSSSAGSRAAPVVLSEGREGETL